MNIWNKLGVGEDMFPIAFIEIYNKEVQRLKKGEEILNSYNPKKGIFTISEKLTMQTVLNTYNDVISKLSTLQQQYYKHYGVHMSLEEKENGFEV